MAAVSRWRWQHECITCTDPDATPSPTPAQLPASAIQPAAISTSDIVAPVGFSFDIVRRSACQWITREPRRLFICTLSQHLPRVMVMLLCIHFSNGQIVYPTHTGMS
ncbi:hypothetical protein OH492_12380 [Vibrio chagasii]|nr:hypothetical protein [Vibrio chagasii]